MVFVKGHARGKLSYFDDLPLSKDDKLICLGFGFTSCGSSSIATAHETESLDELEKRPYDILIVAGPDEGNIRKYPLEERYGNPAYRIRENILILIDGNRYEVEGASFFVLGGGFFSATPVKYPPIGTYLSAFSTLFNSPHFDYVLSVSAPPVMVKKAIGHSISSDLNLPRFLDWMYLNPKITFKRWFSGGFRSDSTWNDVTFLYHSMFTIPPSKEVQ